MFLHTNLISKIVKRFFEVTKMFSIKRFSYKDNIDFDKIGGYMSLTFQISKLEWDSFNGFFFFFWISGHSSGIHMLHNKFCFVFQIFN